MLEDVYLIIIAYGSVSLGVTEAIKRLRAEGIKVGMFRPKTIWPSPANRIHELMQKFDKVLVAELNMGQFADEVQRASGRNDFETLFKVNGRPLSPLEIIEKVKGMM